MSILEEILELKNRALREEHITRDPPPFLQWCSEVSPHLNFDETWIRYVDSEQSKHKNILFSVPPQHGKSTVFTVHKAAYTFVFYPKKRGIIISFNFEITSRFHREIMAILSKHNVKLYSASKREIVHENLMGSISFCGFNSGITSKPADYIIIDDPIRNAADAYSARYQELLWSGFGTSIVPRIQKDFMFLQITQTRWHTNDLIGQIISKNKELNINLDYTYINLPAICESENDPLGRQIGEALCTNRFTVADLKSKMLMAEGDAYALYQGNPSPPDGNIFKINTICLFNDLTILPNDCQHFISVDARFKDDKTSGDYVAILSLAYSISAKKLFLTEIFRERVGFSETVDKIRDLMPTNSFALIEDKANGSAIIDTLKKDFFNLIPINPEGGKIARAHAIQPFVRTHRLFVYQLCYNYNDFISEIKSFPAGTHDDMVDALTQAINYITVTLDPPDYSAISYANLL